MHILDIGSGKFPWFFRQMRVQHHSPHPLSVKIDILSPSVRYYCVDADPDSLQQGIQTYRECSIGRPQGAPQFEVMDGRNLSFDDGVFDIVVISDVFSVPETEWCMCYDQCDFRCDAHTAAREGLPKCHGDIYKGLPLVDKHKILDEAHRVLKSSGKLIVALYQTPAESYRMYDHLNRDPRFTRVQSLCRGENNGGNGDIYWAELVFEKRHNQPS